MVIWIIGVHRAVIASIDTQAQGRNAIKVCFY